MRNHKIIRGLNKNHNCSNQVSHTRGFPCQKSYWFSKKNPAAHPRDICYKREVKGKEESKVHSGCSVVTPHFTPPSTRRNGHKGIQPPHLTGKTSWSHSLKGNPGRNIKMLEEAADQWKTVSRLDTAAPRQPRRMSPRTPSPTAMLRAPFGLSCRAGVVGEPSPKSSAGFRGSRKQKLTSTRWG